MKIKEVTESVKEGYFPAQGRLGASTLGTDNTSSPVGSIPRSQQINIKKAGKKKVNSISSPNVSKAG